VSKFRALQQNSLLGKTGNYFGGTGNLDAQDREFNRRALDGNDIITDNHPVADWCGRAITLQRLTRPLMALHL